MESLKCKLQGSKKKKKKVDAKYVPEVMREELHIAENQII